MSGCLAFLAERQKGATGTSVSTRAKRVYAGLSFVGTSQYQDLRLTQLRHSQLIDS